MRFLANDNAPGDAVEALRASRHDVIWVRTGTKPDEVAKDAGSTGRGCHPALHRKLSLRLGVR
jgi:hypothetical protein